MFRSPYFKTAMMTEVGGKKEMKMEIKKCSTEVLHEALNFMHGVDIADDFQDNEELMELGARFLMDDLQDEAGLRLAMKLSVDNYIKISEIAEAFNNLILAEACADFILHKAEASEVDWPALLGAGQLVATVYMEKAKMWRDDGEAGMMVLYVEMMVAGKSTTFPLMVKSSDTISKVKNMIQVRNHYRVIFFY